MSNNISIPYTLPSQGKLYGDVFKGGEIIIYPIRGAHEELLAGSGDANVFTILQHVSQQLVKLPPKFNFPELLITDWLALLVNLFSFSYSPEFTLRPTCPKCKKEFIQSANMNSLELKTASDICSKNGDGLGLDLENYDASTAVGTTVDTEKPDPTPYEEPFTTKPLPKSGEVIQFRLLRLRDMARIEDYKNQKKNRSGMGNPVHTFTTALNIHSIGGKTDLDDLMRIRWIRSALSYDLRFLRDEISSKETGYELTPEFSCPGCSARFRMQLPIEFFRSLGSRS